MQKSAARPSLDTANGKLKAAAPKRKQPAAAKPKPATMQGRLSTTHKSNNASTTKHGIMPLLGHSNIKLATGGQTKSAPGKPLLRTQNENVGSVHDVQARINQLSEGLLAAQDKAATNAQASIQQLAQQVESTVQEHHAGASAILQDAEAGMQSAGEQHAEAVKEVKAAQTSVVKLIERSLCQKRALADISNSVAGEIAAMAKKYKIA